MFKEIISGFSKFFTKERTLVLIIFLVLAWALFAYSGSKVNVYDTLADGSSGPVTGPTPPTVPTGAGASTGGSASSQSSHSSNSGPAASGYAPQSVANPSDLLPKDSNSQWSALNPNTMNGGDILMPDLLQAGYHIGLDTIGQTLRNPNYQLRSDPVIQKADIGPWNQSTIEPDYGRVPLELGQGPK
jgi:hypothetical protein